MASSRFRTTKKLPGELVQPPNANDLKSKPFAARPEDGCRTGGRAEGKGPFVLRRPLGEFLAPRKIGHGWRRNGDWTLNPAISAKKISFSCEVALTSC